MNKRFYIDVPDNWSVDKDWTDCRYGDDLVKKYTGAESVKFICNSYARISKGDLYEIVLADDQCQLFFTIQHSFKIVPNEIVEKYISR